MMRFAYLTILLGALPMQACSHFASLPPAPKAAQKPHTLEAHGDKREDPYFWLKERENPEVIKHLDAENAYADAALKPVKDLEDELFTELKSRVKEDESTFPFKDGPYYYYMRYETGQEYPIYARTKGEKGPEEILLNVNELAKGHDFFMVPFPDVSPDHTKLIYATDTVGRRFFDLHVYDIASRKVLETIPATTGDTAWANNNKTFFYVKQHPDTLRAQYVYRHKAGQKDDDLIFEEKDETFNLDLSRSRTEAFIFIGSNATVSSEWRYLDANKPDGNFEVFAKRERDHEYSVADGGDGFYVVTNWKAKNFRLMKAPRHAAKKETWVEVIPHRADVLLEGATFFKSHYAVEERATGLTQLRVIDRQTGAAEAIKFPDPAYVVDIGTNAEYDTSEVRYTYSSLNRPASTFDYNFQTKQSTLRKQKETPNLDPSQYVSERVWAPARDGVQIPVSIVYKKGLAKDGRAPLLQYGYGSYGYSMDPDFRSSVFSLLDRGWVFAIAHIRGGSEMGRHWYEDGKLLKKRNTFNDFIDVTQALTRERYADAKRVYAEGGSAGGLLMGAVLNARPDLYHGVHAAVPFVDVVTTMLDDTIPLTTGEYDEWGNPNNVEYYRYMKSYSPYDNVEKKAYPAVLITSGLHDSQVQYWEPTKWAARLRDQNTGDKPILLHTEMEAGHGGSSGRFEALKERAREFAFFLWADSQDR
jgi:oligopeptidase B